MPQVSTLHDYMNNVDQFFLVFAGILVILMSMGWAFLEAGAVRSKNSTNVLIKNIVDTFVAGVAYWLVGFSFAYGNGNKFIGYEYFASAHMPREKYAFFFFQYVFASTSATIVAGAIAERCDFLAYFIYCFLITGFVYPVVTHWIWFKEGWLTAGGEYLIGNTTMSIGFSDFSGSGCVHLVGGTAALVGAIIMGPRLGLYDPETNKKIEIKGHSTPLTALGGFILFFGFLAFNSASEMSLQNEESGYYISISGVNTFLSGSCGALTCLFLSRTGYLGGNGAWSMVATVEGGICGMVAICAGCNKFYPWGAACTGTLSGIFFFVTNWTVKKLNIDDPTETVALHFNGGTTGLISVAFFDKDIGILMNWDHASGLKLGWQLAGWACIVAWVAALAAAMFGIMDVLGILRVAPEVELRGLDVPHHGESAYPVESYVQVEPAMGPNGQVMHISQSAPNLQTIMGSFGEHINAEGGNINGGYSFGGSTTSMDSPIILRIGFETPELLRKGEKKKGRFSKKSRKEQVAAEDTKL